MKSALLALSLLALPAPLALAQNRVWTVAANAPADFDDLQPRSTPPRPATSSW